MENTPQRSTMLSWRVVIGLLVIAYGVLLTAANAGWYPGYRILDHWFHGIALLVLGLRGATCATSTVTRTIGWIASGVGLIWLAEAAGGHRIDITDWWPLIIVGVGVLMLVRAVDFGRSSNVTEAGPSQATGVAFWSGIHRRIASPAFSHADFAAVMGGIEVDLRPATTAGGKAVIEVFVMWGGIEITVPPDWVVQNEAIVIMGGVEDGSSGSPSAQNTLILRGLILMGGVEIKT